VPTHAIRLSAEGFSVVPQDQRAGASVLHWADVTRIRTYKIDLFTVDCICLLFERSNGEAIEVLEEWDGFAALTDVLRERFPLVPADWYATVMQPPFERNEALLYERPSESPAA